MWIRCRARNGAEQDREEREAKKKQTVEKNRTEQTIRVFKECRANNNLNVAFWWAYWRSGHTRRIYIVIIIIINTNQTQLTSI